MLLKYSGYLASACLLLLSCMAQAGDFPRPDAIKPNIDFWKRVYTEIDTTQGFLHDPTDLSRIYATIDVPARAGRQQRKRVIRREKARVSRLILQVAEKPASQLSGEEKRIRELFAPDADAAKIRRAAGNIRFQLGQADKFRAAIERSGLYMDYIEEQLRDAGLPLELSVLPFVESSFNIIARSHVGAAGIWQFMPATGRRFMKVNHVIDERYDPYRATQAAIRLLKYNYDILKSWPLALTAYNHGVGGMRRAVRKTGSSDIGVIVRKYRSRTFGFASRNFYAEFIAALDVYRNANRYFPGSRSYAPVNYKNFRLSHYVPADTVASALGIDIDTLRTHNLSLREPVWNGEKRLPANYDLRVPSALVKDDIGTLLAAIPASHRFGEQVQDKTYRVQRGDSLSRIAALFRVRVSDLVAMNNLRNKHRIRAGQILYLPQKGKMPAGPVVAALQPETPPVQEVAQTRRPPEETVIARAEPAEEPVVPDTDTAADADADDTESTNLGATLAEDISRDDEDSQQLSATDPADYSVADDGTIEVQAAETLGHYADWLQLRTNWLRKLNGMPYRRHLVIGKRIKLDFSKVSKKDFTAKRLSYHKELEDAFFAVNRINGTVSYTIRRGDSLWTIASRHTRVPLWLIRQYNPDNDFSALQPGEKIVMPVVEDKEASG